MAVYGRDLKTGAWFSGRRGGVDLARLGRHPYASDDRVADLANDWLFGLGRHAREITLSPPAGTAAYPIAAAHALTSSDSVFDYLSGATPADGDQCVAPTSYSGGTITWEFASGRMTGRIASVTGGGSAILALEYWREATHTWASFSAIMQGGVIVAAFSTATSSLSQQQTLGNVTFSAPTATLTVNSLYNAQALAAPTLHQIHEMAPAAISQQQALDNVVFTTSATYIRPLTLNPPAGYTARPVLASAASLAPFSLFALAHLGFAPADGDQVVTPDSWNDSGTPRAITWELIGGFPTGVASSVANGPATVEIEYWRASTQTWSDFTMTVVTPTTLVAQGLNTVQALAASVAIPRQSLTAASLAHQQTLEVGQVSVGGAPVKYTRAITLNPPAGRIAYPIHASTANIGIESIFKLLVGTPETGDQAAPPTSYVDGNGVTRAISWELDLSGNMTGRIAEIDGNGVAALTIPYWSSSALAWFTIAVQLQDFSPGLVAQNLTSVQTVATSTALPQGQILPDPVISQHVLFPANLFLQYVVLPHNITSVQQLAVAGVDMPGSLGSLPIVTAQFFTPPTLAQIHELAPQPLLSLQLLDIGPLNQIFTLEADNVATEQWLETPLVAGANTLLSNGLFNTQRLGVSAVLVGSQLTAQRLDTHQNLEKSSLNMPAMGSISAQLTLYPAIWGNISMRSN